MAYKEQYRCIYKRVTPLHTTLNTHIFPLMSHPRASKQKWNFEIKGSTTSKRMQQKNIELRYGRTYISKGCDKPMYRRRSLIRAHTAKVQQAVMFGQFSAVKMYLSGCHLPCGPMLFELQANCFIRPAFSDHFLPKLAFQKRKLSLLIPFPQLLL